MQVGTDAHTIRLPVLRHVCTAYLALKENDDLRYRVLLD